MNNSNKEKNIDNFTNIMDASRRSGLSRDLIRKAIKRGNIYEHSIALEPVTRSTHQKPLIYYPDVVACAKVVKRLEDKFGIKKIKRSHRKKT